VNLYGFRAPVAALAVGAFLVSCSVEPPPPVPNSPFHSVASTEEVMFGLVSPLADVVFESAVYVNGVPEGAPRTDAEWEAVVDAALGLAETGNILMLDAHAQGRPEWIGYADDLIDAGVYASEAALTRDIDTMLEAGAVVWDACLGCHQAYGPE